MRGIMVILVSRGGGGGNLGREGKDEAEAGVLAESAGQSRHCR
jgi:hypothetical protein